MLDYSVVLDSNERARMLAEGYLPEVIEYRARVRFEQLQGEFLAKDAILGRYYTWTSFYDLVADVFPDLDKLMVITGETTYREMELDELLDYHSFRSDVYVTPASFINSCYSGATCRDLYAFVVDVDRITPGTLDAIIENGNLGLYTPMPTYIVNSGSGVHFYYVFDTPVPFYHRNHKALKDMYRVLCGIADKNIQATIDWHAITQPFRLPGSQTKLGQTVTGWKCGEKWSVQRLAKRLGVNVDEMDLQKRPLLPPKEYKAEQERRASLIECSEPTSGKKKAVRKKRKWASSLAGKTGFYLSCLQRCYEKTPEGTRYRSLMALTVVARKVEYPKEQLEKDLEELLQHYNQIGKHMNQSEIKKALRMYNDKALDTRSKTLETWFGWEFLRLAEKVREKQKEAGRPIMSRAEILEEARAIRDIRMKRQGRKWDENNGRKSKEEQIRIWRLENPEGTPKECIAATGISKNTVYKWWKGSEKETIDN